MSQAFKCDLCGECADSADTVKHEREVARESASISGTSADIYIRIGADVAHVCDTCFSIIMDKVKLWVNAHI